MGTHRKKEKLNYLKRRQLLAAIVAFTASAVIKTTAIEKSEDGSAWATETIRRRDELGEALTLSIWTSEELVDVLATVRHDGATFLVKLLEVVRVHPLGQECAEKALPGVALSLEIAREMGLKIVVDASALDLSSLI
jgi:hypothetical protein